MIRENELKARLEGENIHFFPRDEKAEQKEMFAEISEKSPVLLDLKERLDSLMNEKELDPAYIQAKMSYQERESDSTAKPYTSPAFKEALKKHQEQKEKL